MLAPGLSIAPVMLGTNMLGLNTDEAMVHALLDRFTERGYDAVDTADCYAPGSMTG